MAVRSEVERRRSKPLRGKSPEVEVSLFHSSGGPVGVTIVSPTVRRRGCVAYRVKVYLDTPNVHRSDRYHAKESVFPPSKESNTLVQNEKVMQPLGDVRRHRKEFTFGWGSVYLPQSSTMVGPRTDEMPALFDNPGGRAVEPMVITRRKVDNAEEEGVSGLDGGSRCTSTTFHSRAWSHLSCDLDRFDQTLSDVLGIYHGCVSCLAEARSWVMSVLCGCVGARSDVAGSTGSGVGGANQFGQAVLDAVDVSKLAVEHNFVVCICKGDPGTGGGFRSLNTKESIQGVCDSLDLFNLKVLDRAKVQDGPVRGADLEVTNESAKRRLGGE